MPTTLAFDIYGTLIDTNGVVSALEKMIGAEQATRFSSHWRDKQLEYTFRRGLMRQYKNFSVCTRDALEFCCVALNASLSEQQKQQLTEVYRILPAFPDASPALKTLHSGQYKLIAFSNGQAKAVTELLEHAGLIQYFDDVVSADEIKTFKPNPDIYRHLLSRCDSEAGDTWLISGNAFDISGAIATGLKGAWLQRNPGSVFDPWDEFLPNVTIRQLTDLVSAV